MTDKFKVGLGEMNDWQAMVLQEGLTLLASMASPRRRGFLAKLAKKVKQARPK